MQIHIHIHIVWWISIKYYAYMYRSLFIVLLLLSLYFVLYTYRHIHIHPIHHFHILIISLFIQCELFLLVAMRVCRYTFYTSAWRFQIFCFIFTRWRAWKMSHIVQRYRTINMLSKNTHSRMNDIVENMSFVSHRLSFLLSQHEKTFLSIFIDISFICFFHFLLPFLPLSFIHAFSFVYFIMRVKYRLKRPNGKKVSLRTTIMRWNPIQQMHYKLQCVEPSFRRHLSKIERK